MFKSIEPARKERVSSADIVFHVDGRRLQLDTLELLFHETEGTYRGVFFGHDEVLDRKAFKHCSCRHLPELRARFDLRNAHAFQELAVFQHIDFQKVHALGKEFINAVDGIDKDVLVAEIKLIEHLCVKALRERSAQGDVLRRIPVFVQRLCEIIVLGISKHRGRFHEFRRVAVAGNRRTDTRVFANPDWHLRDAASRKLVKDFFSVPSTEEMHQARRAAQKLQHTAAVDALARRIFLDLGDAVDFAWSKLVQKEHPLPSRIQTEN